MPRISDPPTQPADIWTYATRTLTALTGTPRSDLLGSDEPVSTSTVARLANLDRLDASISSRKEKLAVYEDTTLYDPNAANVVLFTVTEDAILRQMLTKGYTEDASFAMNSTITDIDNVDIASASTSSTTEVVLINTAVEAAVRGWKAWMNKGYGHGYGRVTYHRIVRDL